ncbi:MAG TPA: dihydrodipicolinate reductase C-terminal domain-containing protein [Gemmatimonadaceae bacterium]
MTRRLAIIGDGKMGRAVRTLAEDGGWSVVAFLGERESAGGLDANKFGAADVAVEFTEPGSAVANAEACVRAGVPVVVGTTGWYDQLPRLTKTVEQAGGALLWSPNFSVGVNLLLKLARDAGALMKGLDAFDAHIVETHHTKKKDAPSGTAIALAKAVAEGLGHEVPATSVRTGSVPGTHELIFDAPFEQISITHVARDRRVFAEGALHAAEWLIGKKGVFTMADVLTRGSAGR